MTNARVTRESRQDKAAAMRAQAARAEARRRTLIVGGAVLAVIALVIAIFVFIQNARRDSATAVGSTPANLSANNSIVVGAADAPVTLVAYEDFQCPACLQFEQANATQLSAWLKAGTVKIEYRPIAFLDRSSTDNYSTRALNAAAAVINFSPKSFPAFHQALFAQQPAEGGPGLTDTQLIDLAAGAGAPKASVGKAVRDLAFKGWTVQATEAASKASVTSTPTLMINGQTLKSYAPDVIKAAVEAAAKR